MASGTTISTTDLLTNAEQIEQEQEKLNARRNAVRGMLRNLESAGMLNDDERAKLEEIFPKRERVALTRDELVERAKAAGINVDSLQGSGANGNVTRVDLRRALESIEGSNGNGSTN